MKTLGRILLTILLIVMGVGAIAYVDGLTLPVNHSVSVTGVIQAPPAQVFALITDVAHGNTWRPAVKGVTVLPPDQGRDHWVEDLGYGSTMTFLATRTDAPARREVLLDDPNASYGGTWIYELSPGPAPQTTTLDITETGFIHPPIYRFMMAHIFGPTHNLDQYMTDIIAAAAKH
jgi:hypothetical protein